MSDEVCVFGQGSIEYLRKFGWIASAPAFAHLNDTIVVLVDATNQERREYERGYTITWGNPLEQRPLIVRFFFANDEWKVIGAV